MLVSCYHRGLPSSFLCAASVEGKGTKGRDARSACQAGAARPYPGTVLPTGLPLPSPAPGALPTLEDGPPPALPVPHTGLAQRSTWVSPPHTSRKHRDAPGSPLPLLTGPRLDNPPPGTALGPPTSPLLFSGPRLCPPLPAGPRRALPPPQSDRTGLSPLTSPPPPLTGPRPVLPSRQRAQFSLHPLTAACPAQPSAPQPAPGPRPLWLTGAGPACPAGGWRHRAPSAAAPCRPLPAVRINNKMAAAEGAEPRCWPS